MKVHRRLVRLLLAQITVFEPHLSRKRAVRLFLPCSFTQSNLGLYTICSCRSTGETDPASLLPASLVQSDTDHHCLALGDAIDPPHSSAFLQKSQPKLNPSHLFPNLSNHLKMAATSSMFMEEGGDGNMGYAQPDFARQSRIIQPAPAPLLDQCM